MRWFPADSVLWIQMAMAAFGMLMAIDLAFRWIRRGLSPDGPALQVLMLIHNQERQVEGLIRTVQSRAHGGVTLIDWASTDQTPAILERLARANPGLQVRRIPPEEVGAARAATVLEGVGPIAVLMDLREKNDCRSMLDRALSVWK